MNPTYTVERVTVDDPRLTEYQREQVKVWHREWAVVVNGKPAYMHKEESTTHEMIGRLIARRTQKVTP